MDLGWGLFVCGFQSLENLLQNSPEQITAVFYRLIQYSLDVSSRLQNEAPTEKMVQIFKKLNKIKAKLIELNYLGKEKDGERCGISKS